MKSLLLSAFAILIVASLAQAQTLKSNIRYVENGHERHVLDVHAPEGAKNLPVVFWIHGGGWQGGDKSEVQVKPKFFNEQGFVFVSTNYRLLPQVEMSVLIQDVAKSLGWVHKHIGEYGGDPQRILVGGHSAGAQLAALICIDDRYLKAEGVPFSVLKGCLPVDGDTYDIPAIITTAEIRQTVHGFPLPENGHRQKFGNDPKKHIDFSAVTHVAKGKGIPPFLILYVSGHPDTTAQAKRLGTVLEKAEVPAALFGGRETTHNKLNADIGLPDDPATKEVLKLIAAVKEGKRANP